MVSRLTLATSRPDLDAKYCILPPPIGGRGQNVAAKLRDASLRKVLAQHETDARILVGSLINQPSGASIYGTARSRPGPKDNGFLDYLFCEELGAAATRAGLFSRTGAGGGAMEAALRGVLRQLLLDLIIAGKPIPEDFLNHYADYLQGGNIVLLKEQAANAFVGGLATFEEFTLRERWLYEDSLVQIVTPGGFGSMAELTTLIALMTRGAIVDPIYLGAPDDFFERLAPVFGPLLARGEGQQLHRIFRNPRALIEDAMQHLGPAKQEPNDTARRLITDLRIGIERLDLGSRAVSFFGGVGPRTHASAAAITELARLLAMSGSALRLGGSRVTDEAVMAGIAGLPDAEVQAFALRGGKARGIPGARYTRLDDLQSLVELLTLKSRGLVVTPEDAASLALLFNAAVDLQTHKKPSFPIIVLDPDQRFAELRQTMADVMLSAAPRREYISPEDVDLFKVTTDADEAAEYILDANARLDPHSHGFPMYSSVAR